MNMMFYKALAAAFIILTPLFGFALVRLLSLDRFKLNFADVSLPVFIFEIVIVSGKFFTHSFLPHYIIVMALLAIGLVIGLLKRSKRPFTYQRFLKFFWRSGFLVTFVFYLGTVIAIFL